MQYKAAYLQTKPENRVPQCNHLRAKPKKTLYTAVDARFALTSEHPQETITLQYKILFRSTSTLFSYF